VKRIKDKGALGLDFDRRLLVQFRGSAIPQSRLMPGYCPTASWMTRWLCRHQPDAAGRAGRRLLPEAAEPWSLTSLREKLIKIGAKVVNHRRYVTFQMAEVAVSRQMFVNILPLIARLRAPPAPA
jgi:hypothetical protein